MTPPAGAAIAAAVLAIGGVYAVLTVRDPRNMHLWYFLGILSLAVVNGAAAVVNAVVGVPVMFVAHGAFAGCLAWEAWRKRPPRKRRPSRVAARVRDLGHKLAVVPAGGR